MHTFYRKLNSTFCKFHAFIYCVHQICLLRKKKYENTFKYEVFFFIWHQTFLLKRLNKFSFYSCFYVGTCLKMRYYFWKLAEILLLLLSIMTFPFPLHNFVIAFRFWWKFFFRTRIYKYRGSGESSFWKKEPELISNEHAC